MTFALLLLASSLLNSSSSPGVRVDLGGYRLQFQCAGSGTPLVVVETGFDETAADWAAVQAGVAKTTRVCTYDRAGYGGSDPGPRPRTFAQINLELREALRRLGEDPPFVLVGHSFGGPVVRQFALRYPEDVVGLVLAESAEEGQRVAIQGKAVALRSFAKGRPIPEPHLALTDADRAATGEAPESERDWSPEYFARWFAAGQSGSLGGLPLIVLTRAQGGYDDSLDVSGTTLERERLASQARLVALSSGSEQRLVEAGHDLQSEAPAEVIRAILDLVARVRERAGSSATIPYP